MRQYNRYLTTNGKKMITHIESELSTLGGLIIDTVHHEEIFNILTENDFTTQENKSLFKAIKQLSKESKPCDIVTLQDNKGIDLAFIANLVKNTPCANNSLTYAKNVKEAANKRIFSSELQSIQNLLNVTPAIHSLEEIKKKLNTSIDTLSNSANDNLFQFISSDKLQVKPITWTVSSFLEHNAIASFFGPPESAKSLAALDLSLCCAAGIDWKGHKTKKGPVFYIAGEGSNGLSKRQQAWLKANNISLDSIKDNFFFSTAAADLCDQKSTISVKQSIRQTCKAFNKDPVLIIIDTLARNFGSGNENSTDDMNTFISNIDTHLRKEFNATILIIHHSGHGNHDRGRGSSSLKAAMDAEFQVSKKEALVTIKCTKMKDADHPKPISFNLEVVNLDSIDDSGNQMTSVVLNQTEFIPITKKKKLTGKNKITALSELKQLFNSHQDEMCKRGKQANDAKVMLSFWREKSSLASNRFTEAVDSLLDQNFISISDDFVNLTELSESI